MRIKALALATALSLAITPSYAQVISGPAGGAGGTGTGSVIGPGSSVAGDIPTFADTTGQLLQDGGTLSTLLDGIGSTRGSVIYRGAAGWTVLTPGTSGFFLKSNGSGADPSYAAAPGGGTVTSIAGGNGIKPSSDPCTTTCTLNLVVTRNAQVGTTYATAATDGGQTVSLSNASPVAVSLSQANQTGFTAGFGTDFNNIGAGLVTVTATTSVFDDGNTAMPVFTGQYVPVYSDGTNYHASKSVPIIASDSFLGNNTAAATYGDRAFAVPACANDGTHALVFVSHALACASISAGSGTVNAGTAGNGGYYATSAAAISDGGAAVVNFGSVAVSGSTAPPIGIYSGTNTLLFAIQTAGKYKITTSGFGSAAGNAVLLTQGTATATAPNIIPNAGATTTGFGGAINVPAAIVGGATIQNWASTGPAVAVLPTDATHTDATLCRDTTSGAMLSGTGTLGVCLGTSTMRAKENIVAINDNAMRQVMALKPVAFNYKKGWGYPEKKQYYGFLAEDVEKVAPILVGHNSKGQTLNADYVGMIPLLVKTIQKQQSEIESLKKRFAVK